ncbi:tartrate dehydratase [Thermotoga sp. Mc24]|uniref:tartrate dehydratase n=1 Tax=Thermotoga sp. Mc24 TaxID=1231241 RepID=UPI00056DE3CD|nr:tartrate dehydratase [Thermotoga sp. Mc24]
MIVLRYPVSLNVIRKLKTGDVVYYTGKIVVMDRSVVDVLEKYEKYEGTKLYDLTGEIVVLGTFRKNQLQFQEMSEELLEKLFLLGVNGVILEKAHPFSATKRFSRVLFEPLEEIRGTRRMIYKTLDDKKLEELEVERLVLRVVQDSSGKIYSKV